MRGLTPPQKAIALILAIHADRVTAEVWASMQTLAEESGFKGRASATRVIQKLEKAGAIEPVGSRSEGHVATRFRFTFRSDLGEGIAIAEDFNRPSEGSVNRPPSGSDGGFQPTAGESQPTAADAQPTAGEPQPTAQEVHKGVEGVEGKERREKRALRSSSSKQTDDGNLPAMKLWIQRGVEAAKGLDLRAKITAPQKREITADLATLETPATLDDVVAAFRWQTREAANSTNPEFNLSQVGADLSGGIAAVITTTVRPERLQSERRARIEEQLEREAEQKRAADATEAEQKRKQAEFEEVAWAAEFCGPAPAEAAAKCST